MSCQARRRRPQAIHDPCMMYLPEQVLGYVLSCVSWTLGVNRLTARRPDGIDRRQGRGKYDQSGAADRTPTSL
jgi:hypothetical protein